MSKQGRTWINSVELVNPGSYTGSGHHGLTRVVASAAVSKEVTVDRSDGPFSELVTAASSEVAIAAHRNVLHWQSR